MDLWNLKIILAKIVSFSMFSLWNIKRLHYIDFSFKTELKIKWLFNSDSSIHGCKKKADDKLNYFNGIIERQEGPAPLDCWTI